MARTIQSVQPAIGRGPYNMYQATALTNRYPSDGYGAVTGTEGNALWASLADLGFEVVVESVYVPAATLTVTIVEALDASPSSKILLGHATANNWYNDLNMVCRDGFRVSSTGGGAYITFRIQKYMESNKV